MRVTVCELRNDPNGLECDWEKLCRHVGAEQSDLVLLPEIPFAPWPFWQKEFHTGIWNKGVAAHDVWLERLTDLAPATVLYSRPVNRREQRFNVGQVWDVSHGARDVHVKHYLPDESGFWEASWYSRGDDRFEPAQCGPANVGMLICTEIWFTHHAHAHGRAGIQLLATPRATERNTRDKWLAGGRAAAIIAGAYGLSSNPVNDYARSDDAGVSLGGQGWILSPDGDVLALTDADNPFVTEEVDLELAIRAKSTYPRYVQID